jgi:hypothetical protein
LVLSSDASPRPIAMLGIIVPIVKYSVWPIAAHHTSSCHTAR